MRNKPALYLQLIANYDIDPYCYTPIQIVFVIGNNKRDLNIGKWEKGKAVTLCVRRSNRGEVKCGEMRWVEDSCKHRKAKPQNSDEKNETLKLSSFQTFLIH